MSLTRLQQNIQRLLENDPTLTSLDLRNIDGSRSLDIENPSARNIMHDELVGALRDNRTVQNVNLILRFLSYLSDEKKRLVYRAVGSLAALKELRLGHSGFASYSLELTNECLSKAVNLTSLTLHSIHFKGKTSYSPIGRIGMINTNEPEYVCFLNTLSKLHHLESFCLEDIEDTFDLNPLVGTLVALPNLKSISIRAVHFAMEPRLNLQSLEALFKTKTLESLALKRLDLAPMIPELFNLVPEISLKKLCLEQNMMGHACGMPLATVLSRNSSLEKLYLGYNLLPDTCGPAIAQALANPCCSIRELDLSANEICTATCEALGQILISENCRLEYLNLAQNNLRDGGAIAVVGSLQSNTSLRSLTLSETRLEFKVCLFLANALDHNSTLEKINLAENKFGDYGVSLLIPALIRNENIKSLNLFGNRIGTRGVLQLAEALRTNSTLEQLNLAGNYSIETKAYEALENMLLTNFELKHLWLPTTLPGSTIPSLLRLNKIGRQRLMKETDNAQKWLDAMQQCADDIHCLHYLIRANPIVVSWLEKNKMHSQTS